MVSTPAGWTPSYCAGGDRAIRVRVRRIRWREDRLCGPDLSQYDALLTGGLHG